jgi:hypothetical protein
MSPAVVRHHFLCRRLKRENSLEKLREIRIFVIKTVLVKMMVYGRSRGFSRKFGAKTG